MSLIHWCEATEWGILLPEAEFRLKDALKHFVGQLLDR